MNYYETDTEFMERLEQFAFHEVVNEEGQQLDAPTRWLAVLAALVGCQGIDAYREFLPKALDEGIQPEAVKEMVYQSTDYVGMGRMWPFLQTTNEVFAERGITLPASGKAVTTMEDRLEKRRAGAGGHFWPADERGLEKRPHQPLARRQLFWRLLYTDRS